jgi:hypothetical protein
MARCSGSRALSQHERVVAGKLSVECSSPDSATGAADRWAFVSRCLKNCSDSAALLEVARPWVVCVAITHCGHVNGPVCN